MIVVPHHCFTVMMLTILRAFLVFRSQLLRNGSLSSAGDDPTSAIRGVGGFLAIRVLRVRAVCRTITILVASQAKKIHQGEHPQWRVRVPFRGTGAGKGYHRCLASGDGPRLCHSPLLPCNQVSRIASKQVVSKTLCAVSKGLRYDIPVPWYQS